MKYGIVTTMPVTNEMNDLLNHLSGISDMDPEAVSAILGEVGGKTPTIWLKGCSYCWDDEKKQWVKCCVA